MKRFFILLFAMLFCFYPVRAGAAVAETADSDALFRLQLRLSDLGYLTSYPSGVYDDATKGAVERYLSESSAASGKEAHSISAHASPVALQKSNVSLTGIMGQPGVRIDGPYVMEMLTAGATYVLTNCENGAIAHVRYVSGDAHAEVTPVSNWDQATLSGMFNYASFMDKAPVTLTVGSYRVAASLMGSPHRMPDGTSCYCLYFWGSSSGVSGMADVDHERTLEKATAAE